MSAKYTIRPGSWLVRSPEGIARVDRYHVVNPAGVDIAHGCSWRVARKIADALNGITRHELLLARLELEMKLIELRGLPRAVSLQEEA